MEVIFTQRAFIALLAETYEKIKTETGGVFLGFYEGDKCYIVETIDPGPHSIFEPLYFEYDQKYVSHLINKAARIYKKRLSLVGLWHRHPGSFDVFSGTDDGTNTRFARLNNSLTVSMLVNIDPTFRLTVYKVTLPLRYQKISYKVDDTLFPEGSLDLHDKANMIERISNPSQPRVVAQDTSKKLHFDEIMRKAIKDLNPVAITNVENNTESNVDTLLNDIYDDLTYISENSVEKVVLSNSNKALIIKTNYDSVAFAVFGEKTYFCYKTDIYEYETGLIFKKNEEEDNDKPQVVSASSTNTRTENEINKPEETQKKDKGLINTIKRIFFKKEE